jgi:sugar phosphate permease
MLAKKIFTNPVIRGAYLAWFSVTLFYFYQYILRVSPGVMVDQLRYEFSIRAEQFSTLGALYLLAYSLLQIPLGIIVDKVGVKRTVIWSIILCILGSLLFSLANTFWVAQLSRILIGAGSAAAFMCSLKIVADHFPPGKRGLLMGATLTLGTIGGAISGKMIMVTMQHAGWRSVLVYSSILGFIILILTMLLIRPDRNNKQVKLNNHPLSDVLRNVVAIMKHKNIMIYAILAVGLYTPLSALADLWGTAFLKQKFALSQADAASTSTMMYIGLAAGSLFLPWLCERYNVLNRAIFICGIMILVNFAVIIYGPIYSSGTLSLLLITLGFFCGAEMMCFTGALQFSEKDNSGEIIGVVNTLNMLGGAILQQLIGLSLDYQWDHTFDAFGVRQYNTEQFISALSILTVVITTCCLISFSLKGIKIKRQF